MKSQGQPIDYPAIGGEYFHQKIYGVDRAAAHEEAAHCARSSHGQGQCSPLDYFDFESYSQSLPDPHLEYPCPPESMFSYLGFPCSPRTLPNVNEQVQGLGQNIENVTFQSPQPQHDELIESTIIYTQPLSPIFKTYTNVWDSTYTSRSTNVETSASPSPSPISTSVDISFPSTSSFSFTPSSPSVTFEYTNDIIASTPSRLHGELTYQCGQQLLEHTDQMLASPLWSASRVEMSTSTSSYGADIPPVISRMHEESALQFDFLLSSGDSALSDQSNIKYFTSHSHALSPPPAPQTSPLQSIRPPSPSSPPPPSLPSVLMEDTSYEDWEPETYHPNGPKKVAAKDFPLHIQNQVLALAKLKLIRDMFKVHAFLDRKGGPGIASAEAVLEEVAEESRLFVKPKQALYYARYKGNMTRIIWESRKDMFTTGKAVVARNVAEFLGVTCADTSLVQRRAKNLAEFIKVDDDNMLYEFGVAKFSHQIVEVVLHQLFYGDSDKVGWRFSELYGSTVRIAMLAFVLCLLDHVLSEYQTGKYVEKKDIDIVQFRALYDIILSQLKKLDASRLRQEKFRTLLRDWATKFSKSVWDVKRKRFIPVRATG